MSSLQLSSAEARDAFDQLVVGLARQHTRTKFRNYFGRAAGVLDAKVFARGTIIAEGSKPVANLLQEQPESIRATLFTGVDSEFAAVSKTESSSTTLQSLLSEEKVEQGLIIRGKRAELFAYVDPITASIYLHRVVPEQEKSPTQPTQPKKQSRKYRTKLTRPSSAR